jgi:hypothetical protein
MMDQFSFPGFELAPPAPRRRVEAPQQTPARHGLFFAICPPADDWRRHALSAFREALDHALASGRAG